MCVEFNFKCTIRLGHAKGRDVVVTNKKKNKVKSIKYYSVYINSYLEEAEYVRIVADYFNCSDCVPLIVYIQYI